MSTKHDSYGTVLKDERASNDLGAILRARVTDISGSGIQIDVAARHPSDGGGFCALILDEDGNGVVGSGKTVRSAIADLLERFSRGEGWG